MYCDDTVEYDFTISKGTDKTMTFRHIADGEPVDLTDANIEFKCKLPVFNEVATKGDQTVEDEKGTFSIHFNRLETELIQEKRIWYKMYFWAPDTQGVGRRAMFFRGNINFI